jgi:flavodoxin
MSAAKILIIVESIHHGNTMKVAKAMSEELNAVVKKPAEVKGGGLDSYDLIGFGSGIYNRKHHISLFKLIDSMKAQRKKKAFIFSTATIRYKGMHDQLRHALVSKGFDIVGEFICKGFVDHSFIRYIFFGGLNRGRPDEKDLKDAREFARMVADGIRPS